MTYHKCDRCGATLAGRRWGLKWHNASLQILDDGRGRTYDLCEPCAEKVRDFIVNPYPQVPIEQKYVTIDGKRISIKELKDFVCEMQAGKAEDDVT